MATEKRRRARGRQPKASAQEKMGLRYYQDVVRNVENCFRVQVGEKGEERVGYPTADGGYVWKRKGQ
jgi:hypothetical protein